MKKKILSLFLALAMCLSLLPTAAFAADGAQDPAEPGEEILAPEQLGDPEKDPDLETEQEGGPAGVSAPQTGAANSEIAVQATGGHSQYHTEICNTYGCTKHQTLTWSAISSVDQLTSASGETKGYYLTTELELTEPWVPTGTVNLCLSGHSITLRAGTEDAPQSVITVNSDVQLNISNCIAIKPDSTSEGIYYGGPYIRHAEHAVGPGITVSNGGTVELFGGDVTQNSDGVVVENGGTLNMPSNSEVSGNTGAGVRVENGGTLNISGGKIGSNEGCGVDVAQGSTFNVSGGTEILRNTKNSETCNVYLRENATITLSKLSGAEIGVTVETPPTDGNFVPVTSDDNASRNDQNCITSDNTSYRVFYSTSKSNGNLVLDARPTPLHADHDSKTFVNSLSSSGGALLINGEDAELDSYGGTSYYTLPEGNYYLEGDLELDKGLLAYSTNVVLCLNGHNITVTGTSYVIYTAKKTSSGSYTFTLTDCADEPGTLTHSYNQYANGGVCVRDGTFIMRGGKISGNNSGVYVYQGNEFKIYGGEISGNKSYGVSLTPVSGALSGNGKIYMTVGGTAKIKDNWADGTYNAETHLYEQGTTGTAKNVLFTDKPFKYITVDSTLTEGAEIGVTIWKVVTAERDCVAVATCGTSSSADASPYVKYFKSDSADYKVWSRDNNVVIGVWNSEDQTHPVCGAVCNHKDASGKPVHNENIVWTPVSSATGLNNGDNIYLTDDITLTRTWQISAGGTVNLCLNGHTITANGDFDAITLTSNTNTLNICDCSKSCSGKITHGTKEDHTTYSGAGVYMTAAGGRKATVNMYGGTITGNRFTGGSGAGVYMEGKGTFNMYGGSITGNTTTVDHTTGGVYVSGGEFNMTGGSITATGGGVKVDGKGTFNMSGDAVISNNNAYGGGGVSVSNGTFNMSGNAAITGNSVNYGGGVYVYGATAPTAAVFNMSGNASISGNSAKYGGGVYVSGYGRFTMTGGSITGNNVSEAGGVYVIDYDATMTVSGSVQITDNWKNGTKNADGVYEQGENGSANNFYLFGDRDDRTEQQTVTIGTDGLTENARIGIITNNTPTAEAPIKIATNAQDGVDYTKIFTPDVTGQGYTITLPEGETNLYLSAHTHDWEYSVSADNQTIIAKCKDNTCTSSDGGSVTISKPKHEVYRDGKDATAKVTQNSWAADTVSDVTYKNYTGDETPLSPAPTDAGHYIASITVGGKTAWVDYEIGKATPTADDFTFTPPTSLTYDSSPKTATVTSTKIDASYVTVKYYQDGTEVSVPTNAGTYTVKIDVTESGNYTAKADLTDENWAFTILKGTYNGTTTQKTIDIVKGRSVAQTGSLSVADFFAAETELPAGAKIASVTPASGAMMASVTVNDGTLAYTSATGITATADETYTVTISTTNYTDITATLTFHPVEKQPQTSFAFEESAKTVTYGDDNVVVKATGQVAGSKVTYSSENETVAVVDENTGAVVILKASTTPITIKATASATEEYAEKEISCTLTVSPKTLTADDLEFTANSTFTKEYDGTTNCTTATVQIKSVAKVNNGDALPTVTGTYAYNSKDAKGATKVTFTTERTENTNYILPAGLTVEHKASITKRVLTVGTVTATSKQYDGETDAEACIASVPLNGVVDGDSLELDTPTTDGSYYFTADFIDANAGQNKTINGTVVLYPKVTANYTFKDAQGNETNEATFTTTGAIAKADSWALTPVNNLTIRYNNRAEQTYTPDWPKLLPAGQKWTYNLEDTKVTGSAVLADHSIGADSGVLTYQLSAGAENDTVTWTITVSCNNYESFTLTVKLTLIARNEQTGFAFKDVVDGKVTKTYGDADFTITATGAATNSSVTYESSDETVATVDSTGKVTIKGAGTATITAKASATPDYEEKEISYTLTVNKLRIPAPTKGKNELEYTGQEQTYLPDGLDPIYCTIESNKAKDVIAGGSWHNADVSLKDRSNTEWADGADSTAHRPYPFRITPKPVTVTALDKKITAGQPAPELTSADYTVTGLIGNDTLGGISLYYADPSDLSKVMTPDTGKAGTYAIVVTKGGTGSNNYAPTFVNGTLTIASRPSGGVVAVTYPVNVPGETERGSVSSNVKNASKGSTVTITVEPEDGFQLADLTVTDKDGNELPLADKGDGKYTFTMPAGKVEVNATFAEKIETSPFADVSTDAYYYEAVKWAAEQGITGGVGGGLFAPDQSCTRAQIVTFLWRAAGSPEPKSMSSFSDVPEDSYYAKAVAWAVENGITVGTSATTFSPDATCTRAQGVTFLFRAAKASADGAPAFRDVAADAYYAAAVKWATDNSVTNGIGGGLFGSDNDCTRAQIVTFLWRLYAGK